jgi:glucose-6-phosphate 1-dehydrogenase
MSQTILQPKKIKPFHIVVFGGDGDLAFRKIYPAFYFRFIDGQLNVDFKILAVVRKEKSLSEFKERIKEFIELNGQGLDELQFDLFMNRFKVLNIPVNDLEHYAPLKTEIDMNPGFQTVFYLSTPSAAFGEICDTLKLSNLINAKSKVVLEKPLGNSLSSSRDINATVNKAFSEEQIYRIDHYLGKETVQNLMVLRFANHLFEHSWSSEHIESVQITVAESIGVENRGEYYDKSGALLDMVQNHLLQLLCLIAMEPPSKLEAAQVRNEKLKVLNCLRFFDADSILDGTVRGQYSRGLINGQEVSSYLEDIGKYESNTETFVAIKTYVDNWRWKNTPFYLRTGKRMQKRYSEIVINFKSVRHNVFPQQGTIPGNKLIIRLQPEERIALVQMTKVPGPGGYRYKPISLKLDYLDSFNERLPDAYERLMIDVLRGEQTLFMRQDELEAAWMWIESITDAWAAVNQKNILYESGTWGPGDQVLCDEHLWSTSYSKHESFNF